CFHFADRWRSCASVSSDIRLNYLRRTIISRRVSQRPFFRHRRMMVHDEAGAALPRDVCPCPLDQNSQSRSGLGQGTQVHKCPGEPGEIPSEMNISGLQHGETPSNYSKAAFVLVTERRWCRLAADESVNKSAS